MKIDDELLEAIGNLFTRTCNRNGVLVNHGRAMNFDQFLNYMLLFRKRRGITA